MIKTKTIKVHPDDEQNQIDLMTCFGWNLANRQELLTHDNYLTSDSTHIYQHRTTVHFVSLVFQRDTNINNYLDIVSLEEKYYSNLDEQYEEPTTKRLNGLKVFLVIAIIFTAISLLLLTGGIILCLIGLLLIPKGPNFGFVILSHFFLVAPGALIFVAFLPSLLITVGLIKREKKRFESLSEIKTQTVGRNIKHRQIRKECLNKAVSLLQ